MRLLLALVAAAGLAACARPGTATTGTGTPQADPGRVGYVRMDELVKKHPLYGQLAQYDANIEALNLNALVPRTLTAGPDLARADAQLQAQLQAAAKRTDTLLQEKSKEYQDRENAAIAAALRGAAGPGTTSVGSVAGQMQGTVNGQLAGAAAGAQGDLAAYRAQLEAQDMAQIQSVQKTLAARADRTYRAKADDLNAKEAALSLQLANQDAAERLSLRTKLSSLALDDSTRDDVQKRLTALDQEEADALAALRNRDGQTLAALQAQLRAQVQSDLEKQVADIHGRSVARYRERAGALQTAFAGPGGPAITTTIQNGKPTTEVNPNLPPDIRRRITQLHADYTAAFQTDAKQTIADFQKTRADLSQRYAALHGADAAASQSAQSEIATLQHKREELYQQMVAQIGREVQVIAQQRGLSVVLTNVEAPAGGVDLTDDAMKDIETLHE